MRALARALFSARPGCCEQSVKHTLSDGSLNVEARVFQAFDVALAFWSAMLIKWHLRIREQVHLGV